MTILIYGSSGLLGQAALAVLGFALIILGFIVTFVAVFIIFIKGISHRGKARGGGLIMIGPIPIVFGTDKETIKILLILALGLMILALILMLLPRLII